MLPLVARPRAAADLAVGRARVEAPHLRARVRVVRGDRAAHAHLAAGYADDHLVVEVERRDRHRAALLPARIPRAPENAAGRWSSATSWPVISAMNTLPSPIATPRLLNPQHAVVIWSYRDVRVVHPKLFAGRGVEGEDVVVAGRDVHHALVDDRRCLLRVRRASRRIADGSSRRA